MHISRDSMLRRDMTHATICARFCERKSVNVCANICVLSVTPASESIIIKDIRAFTVSSCMVQFASFLRFAENTEKMAFSSSTIFCSSSRRML
eukprot:XP_001707586.1 Hypothetical protein GL50803_27953 [Giardia lamblia ATCC 50803]